MTTIIGNEYDELQRKTADLINGTIVKTYEYLEVFPPLEPRVRDDNNCGSIVRVMDAAGDSFLVVADGLGRTIRTFDAMENTVGYKHAARAEDITLFDNRVVATLLSSVMDAKGTETLLYKDLAGRTVRTVRDTGRLNQVVEIAYDVGSRKVAEAAYNNAEVQVTSYEYNQRSQMTKITYPDSGIKSYTYAADGALSTVTDQDSNTITYTRDQLNRVTNVSYKNSSQIEELRDRFDFYDDYNRVDGIRYENGVLASEARKYTNDIGQLLQERQVHHLSTYSNGWEVIDYKYANNGWEGGGLLSYVYYPGNERIQYQYDSNNRPYKLYRYDGTRVARWSYNADWTLAKLERGNDIDSQYWYNGNKNVTSIRTYNNSGTLMYLNYGYDANNNVLYEDNTADGSWDETYGYDALNRLTAYDRGWFDGQMISNPASSTFWALDMVNNWNSVTEDGVTQDREHSLANEIETVDGAALAHDARGNLTDDGTQLYEWSIDNRIKAVRDKATNNLIAEYHFDSFGRRISKKVLAEGREVDYYLAGNRVIEERDASSSSSATCFQIWGLYIDELLCRYTTTDDYYPIRNRQYSVYRVYDGNGSLVEKYRYSPYGDVDVYNAYNQLLSESASNMTTLFTGRELDSETGLYYFRARMYDAELGRFVSRDPIGYKDGYNLYAGWFVPGGGGPEGLSTKCYSQRGFGFEACDALYKNSANPCKLETCKNIYKKRFVNCINKVLKKNYRYPDEYYDAQVAGNKPAAVQVGDAAGKLGGLIIINFI